MEFLARDIAKRVCKVIKDDGKRSACIQILVKIMIQGESIRDIVKSELKSIFTDEELNLIKDEILKLDSD